MYYFDDGTDPDVVLPPPQSPETAVEAPMPCLLAGEMAYPCVPQESPSITAAADGVLKSPLQRTSPLAPAHAGPVWVKISGFPHWPGIVSSLDEVPLPRFSEVKRAEIPGRQLVYTFGDHMYVWAPTSKIAAWDCPESRAFERRGSSNPIFRAALAEARETLASNSCAAELTAPCSGGCSASAGDCMRLPSAGDGESVSSDDHQLEAESEECGETILAHHRSRMKPPSRARMQTKRQARSTAQATAMTQWDVLQTRKWRPPASMYPEAIHAGLRSAARSRLQEIPNYNSHSVRADITDRKKLLPSDGEEKVDKSVAALLVAEIIPPCAAASLCGKSVSELQPEQVLFAIESAIGNLSPAGIVQSVNAFLRFWAWTVDNDIAFEKVSRVDVEQYLAFVHRNATGQPATSQDQPPDSVLLDVADQPTDQQSMEAISDDELDNTEEVILDQWKGYSAASAQRSLLARLQRHFKFPVPVAESKSPQVGQGARIPPPKRHATPPSPDVLRAVQTYAECDSTSEIMANIAASFLASALSARRARQLQHVFFFAEGEEVAGARTRKKDAAGKGRFEDFLVYLHGVGRSKKWFDRLKKSLHGVTKGKFMYRDFAFLDASGVCHPCRDPRKANRQLNCPLPKWKITFAIRCMLQEATGLSEAQVRVITRHSGRTFLPHCSKARGEPLQRQLEIAGWFGSCVALDGLSADQVRACTAAMAQARVPDGYSSASAFESVYAAVKANCEAVYEFTSRPGRQTIQQVSGDFNLLTKCPSAMLASSD